MLVLLSTRVHDFTFSYLLLRLVLSCGCCQDVSATITPAMLDTAVDPRGYSAVGPLAASLPGKRD